MHATIWAVDVEESRIMAHAPFTGKSVDEVNNAARRLGFEHFLFNGKLYTCGEAAPIETGIKVSEEKIEILNPALTVSSE